MSLLKQQNGDDYPAAALKHLQDSDVLIKGRRFDGAAYLAGYVVECVLKTLIQVETRKANYSHDLNVLREKVAEFAVRTGSCTGRFLEAIESLNSSEILGWKPEMRYQEPGIVLDTAGKWFQDARDLYDRIIGNLLMDGAV